MQSGPSIFIVEVPEQVRRLYYQGNKCTRLKIRKLSLIGSVLTKKFRDKSDIDMLEFVAARGPGLLGIVGMEMELSIIPGFGGLILLYITGVLIIRRMVDLKV